MAQRKVVDARADSDGNITHVRLDGNERFTPVEQAMRMADDGGIANAHTVHNPDGSNRYLRTNHNHTTSNNLDDMAGDT